MKILNALLEKGYFPRELPPPFNTRAFGTFAANSTTAWPKSRWTRCARHNLARPGGLRRPLGIPNPGAFCTATPKETPDVLTCFGEPVYTYSLKQGIEDGFLAPYKVIRVDLDRDLQGWRPEKGASVRR